MSTYPFSRNLGRDLEAAEDLMCDALRGKEPGLEPDSAAFRNFAWALDKVRHATAQVEAAENAVLAGEDPAEAVGVVDLAISLQSRMTSDADKESMRIVIRELTTRRAPSPVPDAFERPGAGSGALFTAA